MFYHSLLSDWNHGNAHFLRGITAELLGLGHEVRVLEPRDAWINPAGGHMGRSTGAWPDPVIFRKVILPWEVRHLSEKR